MTTFADLYSALGTIVTAATNRQWWRKGGIQGVPTEPYATIFLEEAPGNQHEVVELVDEEVGFSELPWGTSRVRAKVEFFKGEAANDASRFRTSMRLSERFYDLWRLCGLSGGLELVDVSTSFREDIEPRAEVRFYLNVNIFGPLPLDGTSLNDIESIDIDITHVKPDGSETEITETFVNTEN